MTNHITSKLTYQNQEQRHKYHHLTTTLHLPLKMTTAQIVETSVTNNSLSKDYPHLDDHAKPMNNIHMLLTQELGSALGLPFTCTTQA